MTEEEKKTLEAENKDMKALSEDEFEGVAGGAGIGGGSKSSPKNFREEIDYETKYKL